MRKGMTLAELLAALSISSIVILTILVLTVFFIRTSGRIMKSNILDEEATKLQTSLDYIISRNWNGLSEIPDEHTISFITSVPQYTDTGLTNFATVTQMIFFDVGSQRVVYTFPATPTGNATNVIAEHISDIVFSTGSETQWLTYDATLSYEGVTRRTNGAVRFF